jgi:ATP-dependent protease HslVU (ClpYQ) peptidase subunit
MSVIVAVKDKNRFVVGSDIRCSCSDGYYLDSYKSLRKIKHLDLNNEIIIGCVGNVAILELFEDVLNNVSKINRKTLCKEVVPSLMRLVKGSIFEYKDGGLDGELLVAYKDTAFTISPNFNVIEIEEYTAIGSGTMVALGSLYTSKLSNSSAEQRVILAIKAAGSMVKSVSKESIIGDTKNTAIKPSNLRDAFEKSNLINIYYKNEDE